MPANPYAAPETAAPMPASGRVVMGWSVMGQRVELRAGVARQRLAIDELDAGAVEPKGPTRFAVNGRPFTLEKKSGFLGPQITLVAGDGQIIPPTPALVVPSPVARGTGCAKHPREEAVLACPGCQRPSCLTCIAADHTHCMACFDALGKKAKQNQADMVLFIPAFFFIIGGGALGGFLGGGAGALAMAAAKRTQSMAMKWVIALALYAVAAVLFVVGAAMIGVAFGK